MPIPRYREQRGPTILSAGFRPFFLLSALWAALAVPIWLLALAAKGEIPSALGPGTWHAHEMIFGYGQATVAGFLLTAIPNWTGRLPLQGRALGLLALLWFAGRAAVLFSDRAGGAVVAAVLDLSFPLLFLLVVAREIAAGRNWRNLPMVAALTLLFCGNLLVHLDALELAGTAALGNRIGLATLLMLISLVGGRIVPSFTRNWLAKNAPAAAAPSGFDAVDRAALAFTALALVLWVAVPESRVAAAAALPAGLALALRLLRWRGGATLREPLLAVLHLGYGWLALGFLLVAFNGFFPLLPPTAALHALTVGAIGTMTLAVMTRASLGHTGRPLEAGPGTRAIYLLVTLAALLRLVAPLGGDAYLLFLVLAGAAWSGAFGLFVLLYARPLSRPRASAGAARPI